MSSEDIEESNKQEEEDDDDDEEGGDLSAYKLDSEEVWVRDWDESAWCRYFKQQFL